MQELKETFRWKSWQKFAFRFLFLFLGFFLFNYELVFIFLSFEQYDKIPLIYDIFHKPLFWIDRHVYHIGYDPAIHDGVPSDNRFGLVFYFTAALLFLVVAIIWGISDKRRTNYTRLNYNFGIYIRYMVAAIMLSYGIDKLIPVQMPFPDITELSKPLGEQDLFSVIWNSVGSSPGYERFAGCCEIIASLLLIFRRTYVFGALFMCTVLCNVVALNIFYNIIVKLYSTLTLICVIFLLIPHIHTLVQFFFQRRAVVLTEYKARIIPSWKKYVWTAVSIVFIGGTIFINIFNDYKAYGRQFSNRRNQRLFEVDWFIAKDTIAPLLSDTLRWKKFALFGRKSAAIYNMRDSASIFDYDKDSVKQIFRIHDNADSLKWDAFHYLYREKNKLELTGKWKRIDVRIVMTESPIDSLLLKKERITFLQD